MTQLIEADTQFVREVIRAGGDSLKKCFQCGTCSVVCSLSPEEKPFPRKEMIWAQWGLKDRLMADPDIWLCHQCADCTTNCPRTAKPGNVLAALRSYVITHYGFPGFVAKAFKSPKYLPVFLAVPALLLFAFLAIMGDLSFPDGGEIATTRYIPMTHGYVGMALLTTIVTLIMLVGAVRFWKGIGRSDAIPTPEKTKGIIEGFILALFDILWHSRFRKCDANKISFFSHGLLFWGLCSILLATFLAFLFHEFHVAEAPLNQTNIVKILGNAGALLVTVGLVVAVYKRTFKRDTVGDSTYFDWFLITMLLLVILTGIGVEVLRLGELATATYSMYLVHLWLMFTLFLYGPYYKGAHIIYRALALLRAKQIGREVR